MLYTVANPGWAPGSALTPSSRRAGLYRTRAEAESISPGRHLLAVAVRYDAERGRIVPSSVAAGAWSAPALLGTEGCVTALASIPAGLVRAMGSPRLRIHEGHRPRGAGDGT